MCKALTYITKLWKFVAMHAECAFGKRLISYMQHYKIPPHFNSAVKKCISIIACVVNGSVVVAQNIDHRQILTTIPCIFCLLGTCKI
jgi:hypothetical protein